MTAPDRPHLSRCARCLAPADGAKGRPLCGLLMGYPDLAYPARQTMVEAFRTVARTRVVVALRLCNDCAAKAEALGQEAVTEETES